MYKQKELSIYKYCLNKGIDITSEPIPIVPAAHYNCGGIGVNLVGKTSLKRLYAVGEVAYHDYTKNAKINATKSNEANLLYYIAAELQKCNMAEPQIMGGELTCSGRKAAELVRTEPENAFA